MESSGIPIEKEKDSGGCQRIKFFKNDLIGGHHLAMTAQPPSVALFFPLAVTIPLFSSSTKAGGRMNRDRKWLAPR